jgi:hypothetical protein
MLVAERDELKVMNIRCTLDAATIEMTDRGLALLVDAIHGWLAGDEDFGISPRRLSLKPQQLGELDRASGELWLWGPHFGGP